MNKNLTKTELENFRIISEKSYALLLEIKHRKTHGFSNLESGNYVISANHNSGRAYQILKINQKTVRLRMYGIVSPKNDRHFIPVRERIKTVPLDNDSLFYLVTQSELACIIYANRLTSCYGSYDHIIKNIKLQKFSEDYVKEENQRLDKIAERYNLTKDCDCITHEGSCFIHHQRYWIGKNAEILTTGSLLADHAFITDEHARLVELSRALARLDHEYPGKTDNELLSINKFEKLP